MPAGAALTPNPNGRSYNPVGVVSVPCVRAFPSTSPFAPNRAGAEPARVQVPSRRSHQLTVPVVDEVSGACAMISWVPPPVSASRAGSGTGTGARGAGAAPSRPSTETDRRLATTPGRMLRR